MRFIHKARLYEREIKDSLSPITWSAINIDYSTAKIKIYAGNDARLNNGTFSVNELYGSANKPSKSDVGLGNVTNDAQVKKTGDT
ncbi:hypothetical protein, partial [Escherichia coli]|uniref:hypothetical protein n=2 Tax=Escherichia coli TaxID=562 RepID=UPI0024BDA1D4